jgi:hypothetical protein
MRNTFGDFMCMHCQNFVSPDVALAGVHHRNHCPYCLSSRHLDLYVAGDRLSACKARMKPVGLALKPAPRKYEGEPQGELMLIHVCEECGKVALNRIAADDDNEAILAVFEASQRIDAQTRSLLSDDGIVVLTTDMAQLVYGRLYGFTFSTS